jgi:hypothetical protein
MASVRLHARSERLFSGVRGNQVIKVLLCTRCVLIARDQHDWQLLFPTALLRSVPAHTTGWCRWNGREGRGRDKSWEAGQTLRADRGQTLPACKGTPIAERQEAKIRGEKAWHRTQAAAQVPSCLRHGEPATLLGLGQDRSTPLPDKLTVLYCTRYIFRAGHPSLASGLRMQKVASRHASGLDTAGGAPRARTLRSAYLASGAPQKSAPGEGRRPDRRGASHVMIAPPAKLRTFLSRNKIFAQTPRPLTAPRPSQQWPPQEAQHRP